MTPPPVEGSPPAHPPAAERGLHGWLDGRWALVALLVVLGAARLGLSDRGAQALPDETFYYHSVLAVEHALDGRLQPALHELTRNGACPGAAVVRLVPAAGQVALRGVAGTAHADPTSLRVATTFHVLVTVALAAAFYALARSLLGSPRRALLATTVHALLANTNLYVRHLLPYDGALLLHLLALLVVLRARDTGRGFPLRAAAWAGLLTGLGFASYPGYYAAPPLVILLAAARGGGALLPRLYAAAGLAVCALGVLLTFELLAAAGGGSYVQTSLRLAGTVTQGAFEEGLTFLPEYLLVVEGAVGAALLVGGGLSLARAAAFGVGRAAPPGSPELGVLLLAVAAAWLVHALGGVLLHGFVFYGRLVHLYAPFLVLGAVAAAAELPPPRWRGLAQGALLAAAGVGAVRFGLAYGGLAYPRDVLHGQGIRSRRVPPERRVHESPPLMPFHSPPGTPVRRDASRVVLVNFAYYYPISRGPFTPHTAPTEGRVVYRGSHFQTFPAYGYEGLDPRERRLVRRRGYEVVVYERTGAPDADG